MSPTEIQTKIATNINNSQVTLIGDGCNCSVKIIAQSFTGMSLLARQKQVLAIMRTEIDSGEVHALSIKAYTPAEASALEK